MGVFMQVMMAQGGWSRTWPTGRLNKTLFHSSSVEGDLFCVSSCDGCFMRGGGGRAVHFTSFGWAKCKYQWEIFSRNCSWRGEEGSAEGLFEFADCGALESLCLYSLEMWVVQGGLPSKRSPCAAQSKDWRVPEVKECYWCLTPRVTDAI